MSATLLASLFLVGCSAQAKRVNCEGRLEPINQPAMGLETDPDREDPANLEQSAP